MNDPFTRIAYAVLVGTILILIALAGLSFNHQLVLWVIIAGCIAGCVIVPSLRQVRADLGLGAVPMIAVFALAVFLGQIAYERMQALYQGQLFDAVAGVDVLHDLCTRSAGLLQTDCAGAKLPPVEGEAEAQTVSRSKLSDLAIWTLLNDAGILDTRNFATPDTLAQAETIDIPTAMLVNFLKRPSRQTETSFGMVMELMRPCGSSNQTGEAVAQQRAMERVLALSLADLEDRAIETSHPALREAEVVAAVPQDAALRLYEFARTDLLALEMPSDNFRAFFDTSRTVMPRPYRDEGILTALLLSGLGFGVEGAPETLLAARQPGAGSADIVRSYLSASGAVASSVCPGFLNKSEITPRENNADFSNANTPDAFEITEEAQFYRALKMREDLALYFIGRIRTADDTRNARFWVTLVTGYEQAAMLMLFAVGCLIAAFRILSLSGAYIGERVWFQTTPMEPQKFIFSIRSSRWPMKLIASILPAVGFVGTVRGIMLSLSGADQIVWASTVNERSAAISSLSTDLGLAFATTLIALLLGIVISVVNASEQRLADLVALRTFGGGSSGRKATAS